jgi:hypothetical protein
VKREGPRVSDVAHLAWYLHKKEPGLALALHCAELSCSKTSELGSAPAAVCWRGTIAQYVGRLHRLYDGKREVRVYDYADLNVPMLARMFDRRCHGYEAIGYTIELPGSAVPGWLADVSLPADPE